MLVLFTVDSAVARIDCKVLSNNTPKMCKMIVRTTCL